MDAIHITVPEAINGASATALGNSIAAAMNAAARVIVFEGRRGVFCRGLDLAALGGTDAASGVAAFATCIEAIHSAGKPTVAVVDGEAFGGGVGIAAACDVVLASASATFALPEVLFGLAPAVIMPVLLERMTPQQARLMALTGHTRTALEAKAFGLVDVIAADQKLDVALRRQVRELARTRPQAAKAVKDLVESLAGVSFDAGVARGVELTSATVIRPEVVAGIRDFLDGETPPWAEA